MPVTAQHNSPKTMHGGLLYSIALVIIGLIIVLAVPTAYEGPMLLYINEQHAVRLLDAIGLAIAIPAWLYLNLLALRRRGREAVAPPGCADQKSSRHQNRSVILVKSAMRTSSLKFWCGEEGQTPPLWRER